MPEHKSLREWAQAEREALRKTVDAIDGDGHTIWSPDHFPDVPSELLPVQFYSSDETPKGTIFNSEGVVAELEGVYGLDLSERLCRELRLPTSQKRGRGARCRENGRVLYQYLDSLAGPVP